jgi:hypothetical protein
MIVSFLPRGCRLQRPVLTAECMCACVPISSRVSLLLHAQRSASALLSTGSPAARTKSHSRHGQRHARGRASLWTGALLRPVSPTIPGACGCTSTAQLGLACRLTRLLRGDFRLLRLLTLHPSPPTLLLTRRGTTGQGATWPPSFWRPHANTDQADTVLNYLVRSRSDRVAPLRFRRARWERNRRFRYCRGQRDRASESALIEHQSADSTAQSHLVTTLPLLCSALLSAALTCASSSSCLYAQPKDSPAYRLFSGAKNASF